MEVFALFWSLKGFPGSSVSKEYAWNVGEPGSIPGTGRSPGEGNANPLQYSCLENSIDRGAWWATVHGVAKSWTQLSDFCFTSVYMPISNSHALWFLNSKSPQVLRHTHAHTSSLPTNPLGSPSRNWSHHWCHPLTAQGCLASVRVSTAVLVNGWHVFAFSVELLEIKQMEVFPNFCLGTT